MFVAIKCFIKNQKHQLVSMLIHNFIEKAFTGPRGFEPRYPAPKAGRISRLPHGPLFLLSETISYAYKKLF